MKVSTSSARAERSRRTILEMLASAVDLSQAPEINKFIDDYRADRARFPDAERREVPVLDDNPMYIRDYAKCILCWRCVQVCAEDAQFTYAINFKGRGFDTGIGTFFDKPMGSKNLKAIALWGSRTTTVADPTGVDGIAEALRERSLSSLTDKYRKIGTVANLAVFDRLGVLPTRNFQQSTFDQATALSGETLTENNFSRRHGCAACTIQCERLFKTLNGEDQRLEYETLFALGPLCGIENPDAVLRAAQLCDHYGMDTISAGGTVAWAMECSERGLLPQTQKLRFGQADDLLAIIPAIAERRGLGALLAEGSRRAAIEVGNASEYWAMHVKGLELPGYEPRSLKTMTIIKISSIRRWCPVPRIPLCRRCGNIGS